MTLDSIRNSCDDYVSQYPHFMVTCCFLVAAFSIFVEPLKRLPNIGGDELCNPYMGQFCSYCMARTR